jgi:hypothetical protein
MLTVAKKSKVSKVERSRVAAMRRDIRKAERVYVYAGERMGFVRTTKADVRDALRKDASAFTVEYVECFGDAYLHETPF